MTWRHRAAVYLVPAGVFQSVIVGGAYGTGREVAEFITAYGPLGGLFAIVAVIIGFTVLLGISFEFARTFRAYDFNQTAPASLLLGEPIVYFNCSGLEGFTCVAEYLVDKCYAANGYTGNSQYRYVLFVAGIKPQNVEQMFANYEPINLLAEEILRIITPAACNE